MESLLIIKIMTTGNKARMHLKKCYWPFAIFLTLNKSLLYKAFIKISNIKNSACQNRLKRFLRISLRKILSFSKKERIISLYYWLLMSFTDLKIIVSFLATSVLTTEKLTSPRLKDGFTQKANLKTFPYLLKLIKSITLINFKKPLVKKTSKIAFGYNPLTLLARLTFKEIR